VDIWWQQPAASECILDTFTVNARPLDYYVKLMDEKIAEYSRNKTFY